MKILKFGGQSLKNGTGIQQVIQIIKDHYSQSTAWTVVLSARANATNELLQLIQLAQEQKNYLPQLEDFQQYQSQDLNTEVLKPHFLEIQNLLRGIYLTGDYTDTTKDQLLAQGELLALKYLKHHLDLAKIPNTPVDSRLFLKAEKQGKNVLINEKESAQLTQFIKDSLPENHLLLTTGFIASDAKERTLTLGRNGSNYSASLLASFLDAEEILSYTHINGVYSAHPEWVQEAQIIPEIHYNEANELASFGAQILHAKTISPLKEKQIPLRIKNTFQPEQPGTLIHGNVSEKNIKALAVQENMALIQIQGKGLLGKKGIDAQIFNTLAAADINVGIISQGSSERGISFAVDATEAELAVTQLKNTFKAEILNKDIQKIEAISALAVLAVIGTKIEDFSEPLKHLKANNVPILLLNNTLEGRNIGLVIPQEQVKKALNIIHGEIFGIAKNIHIAIVGKGTVGGSLIRQILEEQEQIKNRKHLTLKIFAIAGQHQVLLDADGIKHQWQDEFKKAESSNNITKDIISYAKKHQLENLIIIDNTASSDFVDDYSEYVKNGFDLISSNKIANTQSFEKYKSLRQLLTQKKKNYLYETNVGAGLPIIDTIKLLHSSGENITRIRGVFSGTLSYLFNQFSEGEAKFGFWLDKAISKGYTEPDPRDDLNGKDVARKLLILARELDLSNEFEDISITSLYPENMEQMDKHTFLSSFEILDDLYQSKKAQLGPDEVLRYVADLSNTVLGPKGNLKVSLEAVPKQSALGQLQGSDSLFEIYTSSYGDHPITIIGAGAGAEVTARGVFGDLLRIADKK